MSRRSPPGARRCTTTTRSGATCARAVTAIDGREPIVARIERRDGMVIDMTTMPLPDGATLVTFQDVSDSVNVERALARAQRGAGSRRRHQDRFRAPRVVRAALAAHQHHRLRPSARRSGFRPAHRQAARISRLHHHLDQRAARHHQQHPRPRHHRRRRHDAQPRARSTSAPAWRRRPKACRTAWSRTTSRLDIRAAAGIGSFTADERRLRQILFNLLSNAVGFSPPGGTVTLAVDARAGRGDVLRHRPAVPASRRKRRTRYSTGSRPTRAARSTAAPGSGLSLVRSFVELHGGTVTIDSVPGAGHHGHLRIPGRARGKAECGLANKCPSSAARRARRVTRGGAKYCFKA